MRETIAYMRPERKATRAQSSPDRSFYPADFAVLTALVFLIMMRIFNGQGIGHNLVSTIAARLVQLNVSVG